MSCTNMGWVELPSDRGRARIWDSLRARLIDNAVRDLGRRGGQGGEPAGIWTGWIVRVLDLRGVGGAGVGKLVERFESDRNAFRWNAIGWAID